MFSLPQTPIEININLSPQQPPYLPCPSAFEDMFCSVPEEQLQDCVYIPTFGEEKFGFAAPALFKALMRDLAELDEDECSKQETTSIITHPDSDTQNKKDMTDDDFKYWFK